MTATTAPPSDQGLGSWPRRRAQLSPDRIAWTFEGTHTTFAELDSRVERLAAALRARGVERGDRVAYLGANHPALLETLFATGRIGAVAVILNARLSPREVDYILGDCTPRALVLGEEQLPLLENLESGRRPAVIVAVEGVDPDRPGQVEDFEAVVASGRGSAPAHTEVARDDACLIMYTSGTTGRPKGAVLSHGNMLFSALNVVLATDLRPDDVCLAVAPLFHIAGLNGLLLPVFLKGGRSIIHRGFDPAHVLDALRGDGVTSLFAVPAMLDAIAALPEFEHAEFSGMRTLIAGGAPVPDRMLRQWNARAVEVQQGYGFTEAAPAVLLLSAEDAVRKAGSAGRPHFFVDARVVDEGDRGIAPGGSGEIVVRAPNVMLGYWERPEATAEVLQDGWYRSGDIATLDDEGFVTILDRSKDLYISGGENVYPSEVESALLELEGVAEAAVIGVPDERWGEVGKAFVVARPGTELAPATVLAGLDGRLARYKLPKSVELVASLPRTASGKVQKHELRAAEQLRRAEAREGTRTVTSIAELPGLVGRVLGVSEPIDVPQSRIDRFAEATEDRQWIHVDPVRAAEGPFGSTVAHGFLTLSLVAPLIGSVLVVRDADGVVNYGVDRVRFPAPLRAGARVRLEARLVDVDPVPGGVQARIDALITAEGATKPAVSASCLVRFLRTGDGAASPRTPERRTA